MIKLETLLFRKLRKLIGCKSPSEMFQEMWTEEVKTAWRWGSPEWYKAIDERDKEKGNNE